ncbi:MAG: hypothetical protein KKB59_18395, partial [Spirochaetes bacterium]|nr:hypothetical protein [Spirochaetota bacterium]
EILNLDFKNDAEKKRLFILETLKSGGLDVSPFKEKLKKVLDEDLIRKSDIDYGLVTLSLSDLKPIECFIKDIPKGELANYIIASANFPAFRDEKIDNKRMLDGGFFDNLPVNLLLERGCDEVIAIRVMAIGRIRKIKESDRKKVVTIEPSEDLGKVLEIDPERAKKNIKMGYYDTMRVYKKLQGSRYYLTKTIDESEIVARLLALPSETLDAFSTLISSDKCGYRVLFEEIVPMVIDLLKIDKNLSYEQILVAFYEFLAEEADIDRYELMDLHHLIKKVNAYYLSNVDKYENEMDEIVKVIISTLPYKSVSFFPQKLKRDFLFHIYYIVTKGLQSAGK